jgi:hypothetical protein
MRVDEIRDLSDEDFRRLTGVKKVTFDKMVEVLTLADLAKKAKGGRPSKLSISDKLLIALEYSREYRTYFHISSSYGISESSAYKNIKWVEDTLVKCGEFALPGKKALHSSDRDCAVVLVDATETPIQRPKKSGGNTTRARKSGIR